MRFPEPVCQSNHRSAYENYLFVCNAVKELVSTRCVVECDSCPTVSSPLSVVVNAGGKKRIVLDLRYINQFLPIRKFKYEGLGLTPSVCSTGDFFTTFNLKSGFHHVDIHKDCWPYHSFSWSHGLTRKWYMFQE